MNARITTSPTRSVHVWQVLAFACVALCSDVASANPVVISEVRPEPFDSAPIVYAVGIASEVFIAAMFGLRRRELVLVALLNVLTIPGANFALMDVDAAVRTRALLAVEASAVILEWAALCAMMRGTSWTRGRVLALCVVANAVSYGLGRLLTDSVFASP